MLEYKGHGGSKITFDGDNVYIKQVFAKENCTVNDIVRIESKEPSGLQSGIVKIWTKKSAAYYSFIFQKKDTDTLMELYNLLKDKCPAAIINEGVKVAVNANEAPSVKESVYETSPKGVTSNIKFCPECGASVEGVKFCPECGTRITNNDRASVRQPVKVSVSVQDSGEPVAHCPKCGSTSLTGNKKGFGVGKAVVGAVLTGGIGLAAGNIGAKKVRVTCLNCGKQFWAGKA